MTQLPRHPRRKHFFFLSSKVVHSLSILLKKEEEKKGGHCPLLQDVQKYEFPKIVLTQKRKGAGIQYRLLKEITVKNKITQGYGFLLPYCKSDIARFYLPMSRYLIISPHYQHYHHQPPFFPFSNSLELVIKQSIIFSCNSFPLSPFHLCK